MENTATEFFRSVWVVYGVPGVAILVGLIGGFYLFRYMSTKWLEEKFQERMELFKHAQAKEIERVKFDLNFMTDRNLKLNQFEFEVVPEMWRKLTDAYADTVTAVANFNWAIDFSGYTEDELKAFLISEGISERNISLVLRSQDKMPVFFEAIERKRTKAAFDANREFQLYQRKYAIFIPKDLNKELTASSKIILDILMRHDFNIRMPGTLNPPEDMETLVNLYGSHLSKIENMIMDRLWSSASRGAT
ncbi:hypothetical protein [Methylobacterium sp. Leaf99]|uniref:hypothetical protein n=1 Tax=Methylobacterium sp. Leaf99 TaxID=1736251 RepID=UPI000AABA93E|nr:hypothetical protein [Methylobacterium sp. Leaf99]